MDNHNKFYLIDGSSYIFRAFFGVRQQLLTSKGFPTNALYGFINMLQKVIRDEKPDYLVVAFDTIVFFSNIVHVSHRLVVVPSLLHYFTSQRGKKEECQLFMEPKMICNLFTSKCRLYVLF